MHGQGPGDQGSDRNLENNKTADYSALKGREKKGI